MSTYSVRLASGELPSGQLTVYTAPTGQVTVVRDLILTNGDSAAHQMWCQINVSGSLSAYIYREPSVPATTSVHLELRQVLHPGDELAVGSVGPSAFYAISGYALSL